MDPADGGAFFDDPWRRNEERDPDKAASMSSSEASKGSLLEIGRSLTRIFWDRLLPFWDADCVLPAVAGVDEVHADPDVALNYVRASRSKRSRRDAGCSSISGRCGGLHRSSGSQGLTGRLDRGGIH